MDKKSFKWFGWIAFGLLVIFAFSSLNNGAGSQAEQPAVPTTITFSEAQTQIRDSAATIKSVTLLKSPQGTVREAIIERTDGSRQTVVVPGEAGAERLLTTLSDAKVAHVAEEPKQASGWSSFGGTLLSIGMMILPLIFIFWLFSRDTRRSSRSFSQRSAWASSSSAWVFRSWASREASIALMSPQF